jgi:hypothetical protein
LGRKAAWTPFLEILRKNMMGGALLIVALVNTHTNRKEIVHSMEADTVGANTMVEHLEAVPIDASSGTCKNEGDFCVGNHCVKVPCKNEPRRLSPCTPCTDPSHPPLCSSRPRRRWSLQLTRARTLGTKSTSATGACACTYGPQQRGRRKPSTTRQHAHQQRLLPAPTNEKRRRHARV